MSVPRKQAESKKKPEKKKKSRQRRVNLVLVVVLFAIIFIVGLLISPYLWQKIREIPYLGQKGGEIKEWFAKPPFLEEDRVVKLYFSESKENYLLPQERRITSSAGISGQARAILAELANGPSSSSLVPTMPPKTEIRAVYVQGNCIYVDFSSDLRKEHPGGSSGELLTVYSIVNSLLENLPSQSSVQILIQGRPADTLAGHIDIRHPLSMNLDLLKVVPAG